ncbi:MAG: calcium-translocating P-type ATPase, PMCA-type [Muribaculaceae bacterium]|nr:calcium-translocating P-type ATPase, PMCA-type [Muribaculaceae bacterium]
MSQHQKYHGLTQRQVEDSRKIHGVNVLTPPHKDPLWKKFLAKFKEPLIIILLIAGVLSIGISIYEYCLIHQFKVFFEPLGIFIAIILATGLAFIFETKADREFDLLNKVNDEEPVTVIRDDGVSQIPRKDVVVGDIVILNTGEEVPADGELLEAVHMSVDESTLTGEPIAAKTTDPEHFNPEDTFPSNHVMRGTKVMEGHGVMRVLAVGDATENGKVFEAAQIDNSVKTPLNEQLERLGGLISKAAYIIAVLIIVGRIIIYFSSEGFVWINFIAYLLETIMVAVTLIVVAVPEGLPMAVTLSLAYSMRRMLKSNNLVRKLHACETMGATTVICTDKTGTLTENRMRVYESAFFIPEADSRYIYQGMAVNSTAQLEVGRDDEISVLGNPTEGALLLWMRSMGEDYVTLRNAVKVVDELPFTTERKYMATVVESDGQKILYAKGAPEVIFSLCSDTEGVTKEEIDAKLLQYQNQAMRTLGFAYQILKDGDETFADGKLVAKGLKFIGIVAISDPVRGDVPDAVREVINAGVKVKIVTGDTTGTAKEIGRQIGLWNDEEDGEKNIITGTEFEQLDDEELLERVEDLKIIARARPLDKKRLVEALQQRNEVVAVTGDGTNDAPALKSAHVGLSMGDGTSVAKEASDITIVDNSFSSIGRAVMWGRSLYKNIGRFVLFQMTVNVAACLIVLFGAFMDTESPLTVTQMLWVNLIMDTFAAVAMATLPPEERVMLDAPRKREDFIINRPMRGAIITTGGIFFMLLLGLLYIFNNADITCMADFADLGLFSRVTTGVVGPEAAALTPYELSLFFTIFVFLQFWNMFNAKAFSSGRSALCFRNCRGFLLIAALIFGGQILIVSLGGNFFNVVPLKFIDWVIIICTTSLVLWIGEVYRKLT